MKSFLKKLLVVTLAAVLGVSALLTMAACGNKGNKNLSFYVFAGQGDQATYTELVNAWAKQYAEKLKAEDPDQFGEDFSFKVETDFDSDPGTYFDELSKRLRAGNAPDVFYVSPKYVKSYVANDYALDLTSYIDYTDYDLSDVWGAALGSYAYNKETKTIGKDVAYNTSDGKFYQLNDDGTVSSNVAGIYGLPKDYSSFGFGYNANFFSDELKAAYTSQKDVNNAVFVYNTDKKSGSGTAGSVSGTQANIINIGVPTTYYPFNFYNYSDFNSALKGGDPVARLAYENGGYTVTLPGWPGQTYDRAEAGYTVSDKTLYDDGIGYIVYSYQEYAALSWAVSYYCTVYDTGRYEKDNGTVKASDYGQHKLVTWLNTDSGLVTYGVYGNDQYDQATYYLTAWLYGNDASMLNDTYDSVMVDEKDFATADYGVNSEGFIEAYAAFLAYGSDWNNNIYFALNDLEESICESGGYTGFSGGYTIFYGLGTWDASTYDKDKSVLDYQLMPAVVSEDYALYSEYKDYNYEPQTAGTYKASYTEKEILDNQETRQGEWGVRMDTVGYGVNADVLDKFTGKNEWKVAAAADLCAYMTIDYDTQVSLTYSGSQIPNYISQCQDYLNGSSASDGYFADMVTPESEQWDVCYAAALKMQKATRSQQAMTVKEYLESVNSDALEYLSPTYADIKVSEAIRSMSSIFRCFRMISYTYESRNLMLRAAALNGAQDPCTFTYEDSWWTTTFVAYKATHLFTYRHDEDAYDDYYKKQAIKLGDDVITTPYYYCLAIAPTIQSALEEVILKEQDALG